jgi:hypothetical protein
LACPYRFELEYLTVVENRHAKLQIGKVVDPYYLLLLRFPSLMACALAPVAECLMVSGAGLQVTTSS